MPKHIIGASEARNSAVDPSKPWAKEMKKSRIWSRGAQNELAKEIMAVVNRDPDKKIRAVQEGDTLGAIVMGLSKGKFNGRLPVDYRSKKLKNSQKPSKLIEANKIYPGQYVWIEKGKVIVADAAPESAPESKSDSAETTTTSTAAEIAKVKADLEALQIQTSGLTIKANDLRNAVLHHQASLPNFADITDELDILLNKNQALSAVLTKHLASSTTNASVVPPLQQKAAQYQALYAAILKSVPAVFRTIKPVSSAPTSSKINVDRWVDIEYHNLPARMQDSIKDLMSKFPSLGTTPEEAWDLIEDTLDDRSSLRLFDENGNLEGIDSTDTLEHSELATLLGKPLTALSNNEKTTINNFLEILETEKIEQLEAYIYQRDHRVDHGSWIARGWGQLGPSISQMQNKDASLIQNLASVVPAAASGLEKGVNGVLGFFTGVDLSPDNLGWKTPGIAEFTGLHSNGEWFNFEEAGIINLIDLATEQDTYIDIYNKFSATARERGTFAAVGDGVETFFGIVGGGFGAGALAKLGAKTSRIGMKSLDNPVSKTFDWAGDKAFEGSKRLLRFPRKATGSLVGGTIAVGETTAVGAKGAVSRSAEIASSAAASASSAATQAASATTSRFGKIRMPSFRQQKEWQPSNFDWEGNAGTLRVDRNAAKKSPERALSREIQTGYKNRVFNLTNARELADRIITLPKIKRRWSLDPNNWLLGNHRHVIKLPDAKVEIRATRNEAFPYQVKVDGKWEGIARASDDFLYHGFGTANAPQRLGFRVLPDGELQLHYPANQVKWSPPANGSALNTLQVSSEMPPNTVLNRGTLSLGSQSVPENSMVYLKNIDDNLDVNFGPGLNGYRLEAPSRNTDGSMRLFEPGTNEGIILAEGTSVSRIINNREYSFIRNGNDVKITVKPQVNGVSDNFPTAPVRAGDPAEQPNINPTAAPTAALNETLTIQSIPFTSGTYVELNGIVHRVVGATSKQEIIFRPARGEGKAVIKTKEDLTNDLNSGLLKQTTQIKIGQHNVAKGQDIYINERLHYVDEIAGDNLKLTPAQTGSPEINTTVSNLATDLSSGTARLPISYTKARAMVDDLAPNSSFSLKGSTFRIDGPDPSNSDHLMVSIKSTNEPDSAYRQISTPKHIIAQQIQITSHTISTA